MGGLDENYFFSVFFLVQRNPWRCEAGCVQRK